MAARGVWRHRPEARIVAAGGLLCVLAVLDGAAPWGVAALAVAVGWSLAVHFLRLYRERQELDRLAALTPDMLCVVTADGHFKRINPAFSRVLGYSTEVLLATPLTELIHPEDRRPTLERFERLVRGEPVEDIENRYRCRDGSYRLLSWRSNADTEKGLIYGIARDVTEKRRTEEDLIQAKEAAEQASQARSQFLANMSHEVRTPMNGILGMVRLLLKGELGGRQREYAENIHISASALLAIIDDILDFSRIEADKLRIEAVDFRLREMLGGVAALLRPRAAKRDLDLRLEIDEATPDELRGDPTRLRQVVLNLAGNGIKFTEEGSVVVKVEPVSLDEKRVELRFTIRDTGIGIPLEAQPRLFTPFTQADSSMTRKFGGSGLGLVISRRIAELMGGEITFESTPGKGSTFFFTLPLELADGLLPADEAEPAEAQAASFRERRSYRILVVEDEDINRLVVLRQLEDLGYLGEGVGNGLEALEALDSQRFDLVLMDCQMPDLDGYETIRRLRQREAGRRRHLPVIAITAHAMKGDREKCLHAGMDDYIAKPFDEVELAEALDRWLDVSDHGTEVRPAAAEPTPEQALSAPMLRDLLRLGEDFFAQMAENFLREGPLRIERLRRLQGNDDLEPLATTAHGLASIAGTVAAVRLAELCHQLEKLARKGAAADCPEALRRVEEGYELAAAELRGIVRSGDRHQDLCADGPAAAALGAAR